MKNAFFGLLRLVPLALHAQTPTPATDTGQVRDSVVLQKTLYFNHNIARWITQSECYKMAVFIKNVEKYPDTKIRIVGWTDKNGSDELNLEYMMSNYHHYDVISRELVDYGQTKQYRSIFPAKAKISLV